MESKNDIGLTNAHEKIIKLKIAQINVNSIISNERRANLLGMLREQDPDVVLLCETKLNDKHKIQFKKYKIIRNDRTNSNQGGGTAILIKKEIKIKEIINLESTDKKLIEKTIINLELKNNKNFYIVSAYAPGSEYKNFIKEFKEIFFELKLHHSNNYFIIGGDFNAKHQHWKNLNNNNRGTKLAQWLEAESLYYKTELYHSENPSYPAGGSYLDILLMDTRLSINNKIKDKEVPTLFYDSDHNGLITEVILDQVDPLELGRQQDIDPFNYRKANWKKFKNLLEKREDLNISQFLNINNKNVNDHLERINEDIREAMNEAIPKTKPQNSMEVYINAEIKKLHKYKSFLLTQLNKNYKKYQDPENLEYINYKNLIKKIKYQLKLEFNKSISNYWQKKVENIRHTETDMFPQINRIFRQKNKNSLPALVKIKADHEKLLRNIQIDPTTLERDRENNFVVKREKDKPNVIGAFFADIHSQNQHMGKTGLSRIIEKENKQLEEEITRNRTANGTICTFNQNNPSMEPTTNINYFTHYNETKKIFKKLNNKKSFGHDKIPNIVLKNIPKKYIKYYTILFNNLLNNCYFPKDWKKAKVIPIPKKNKDASLPANLRPISLLPNISKVFEVIINKRLVQYCDINDIIPEYQFGFRFRHSTIHALTKFTSDISRSLLSGEVVGACLIDIEKAFDTTWREGLIYKMIKKGFDRNMIKMVYDMIGERSFFVDNGSAYSNEFAMKEGLQQGTVNSPLLFNIYISDLMYIFNINKDKMKSALAFADDLIIYASGRNCSLIQKNLQNLFEKIYDYYNTWKLKINLDKCETILFRPTLRKTTNSFKKNYKNFKIEINNKTIPHKNQVKYLGINFDDRLHFNKHVEIQQQKARAAFMIHKNLFYNKYLDPKVKLLCYQLLVRPIITYGCSIWFNQSASVMERLRAFERSCLRACLGQYRSAESGYLHYISNKKIYDLANINRIDCFIIRLIRDYYLNASQNTRNSLIFGAIYPNELYFEETLKSGHIPPEAFIYLDNRGYIQDEDGIPIIYHIFRHKKNKKIIYEPHLKGSDPDRRWRFNMDIPIKDTKELVKKKKKYFWIQEW